MLDLAGRPALRLHPSGLEWGRQAGGGAEFPLGQHLEEVESLPEGLVA